MGAATVIKVRANRKYKTSHCRKKLISNDNKKSSDDIAPARPLVVLRKEAIERVTANMMWIADTKADGGRGGVGRG